MRVGMKKINVIAEVLETSEPSKVHTQFRDNALVSNAWIGDETGKIMLCLWDQQVNFVISATALKLRMLMLQCLKLKNSCGLERTAQ